MLLAGCSSTANQPPQATAAQASQAESGKQAVSELSAGKSVNVQTSQGNIEVEPTVVAMPATQAKADSVTGQVAYYDPWESANRAIFSFNHTLYSYVLIPAANGYRFVVPAVARDKIGNAFANIREPLNLLNHLASGQFRQAGVNAGRFIINSTLGLFGLFDPALHWFEIQPQPRTLADTLQYYDVDAGPYLVLPILGPGDTRGAFSVVTEGFIHPINQLVDAPESYYLRAFDGFDDFSQQAETYETLHQQADDPYIYFRNQYIQGQRRDEYFQFRQGDTQP